MAEEETEMLHAKGTFEVKMGPTEVPEIAKEAGLGAMTIDKGWKGDVEGTSKGEMVHGGEPANGAMVYVALEKMTVRVHGKQGTFVFAHQATMLQSNPGAAKLSITIVPETGTGELKGIRGELTLVIEKGVHSYDLAYELA